MLTLNLEWKHKKKKRKKEEQDAKGLGHEGDGVTQAGHLGTTHELWSCRTGQLVWACSTLGQADRMALWGRPKASPTPGQHSPSGCQLLELLPVLHKLGQALLDLLLSDGVVIRQLLASV